MKCGNCGKKEGKIFLIYLKKYFCNSCFIKIMRKRINRNIKNYKMFSKNDDLFFIFDGSAKSVVCFFHVFNLLSSMRNINFYIVPTKNSLRIANEIKRKYGIVILNKPKKKGKIVLSDCLEDTCEKIIKLFVEHRKELINEIKPLNKNFVKPLFNIPMNELEIYAKLKNYKYMKTKEELKYVKKLEKIEEMRPGLKFSLVNLFEKMISFQ
jgi:tRNA(Ile)-lysidine synthase TilS/MesJ